MKRQQGVTLIIVLVVVALATLIAAQMIEHGRFSDRRTQLILAREQAYQLALGGEALAQQWLGKGFDYKSETVHLNQPWATTPLEFPIEGGMIKGTVKDAQSCFNLNAIDPDAQESQSRGGGDSRGDGSENESPDNSADGRASPQPNDPNQAAKKDVDFSIYEAIVNEALKELQQVDISPDALASTLQDWIDQDINPTGYDGAEDLEYTGYDLPYRTANSLMAHKSELRVIKGYSAKVYKAIKDWVCVLPDAAINKINVNTLEPEHAAILKALIGDIPLDKAKSILAAMPEDGFNDNTFWQEVNSDQTIQIAEERKSRIGFTSSYFIVTIQVDYHGAAFRMSTLMVKPEKKDAPFKVAARYFGEF